MNGEPNIDMRAMLIARAEGYRAKEPGYARFLRAAAEAADPEDLTRYGLQQLDDSFRKAYGRLGKRELERFAVYVVPPQYRGDLEVIEVFSRDMPFIVDSVLAAVRAMGGTVRLMTHPVLLFDPATYRVLDEPTAGSRNESFLHIEIEPLADDQARARLKAEIEATLTEVGRVVAGWQPMLERIRRVGVDWHEKSLPVPPAMLAEAVHFLDWLTEHNFTFLGMCEYRLEGEGESARLVMVPDSEMGLFEDPELKVLRSGADFVDMTPQHAEFFAETAPLMVTKANLRSRVHRRVHMDYVAIKLYDADGTVSGELRVLGLFTSQSLATPNTEVPLLRRKVSEVMRRSELLANSHAGKALMSALDSYPRDELFQISEDQLLEFSQLIADLTDRPRVRVLSRIDRFDNFVSVLVYVPRDRYDSDVRARIGDWLAEQYDARISVFSPSFPEGDLVRVHFILGRNGGETPQPSRWTLETGIAELIRTFADRLRDAADGGAEVARYLDAFSPAYQARYGAPEALSDIEIIRLVPDARSIALRLGVRPGTTDQLGLRFYHREAAIPLSDRVPMLENFGFRVIDEQTYEISPEGSEVVYLHDMMLAPPDGFDTEDRLRCEKVENAILAIWRDEADSDGLNRLTSISGLGWDDVMVLRALTQYLHQTGLPYSRRYLIDTLVAHADVATALVTLFHTANDPHYAGHRERAEDAARETITAAIDATTSLDEDRILRRYLNLVDGVVRTNAYQRDEAGARRPALALKFDCAALDGLPEPVPYREIFVYSPRVEGLHLRFGPIARGGLRWSDRPDDFRTEVLGLVKAQQVKNAIIVPVGAKGAFVPKKLPSGDRDAFMSEGTTCYQIFVTTLLDVTDNLEDNVVVGPPDVVRQDGDDPYLVVAADKGTARFSDTANAIAVARDFWLGDAFASGGSAGYDHKVMGITARGAWEAVKRHFRELDRDIQTTPFTAVGVGDMSGDVFGNGVLLSEQLRLVAAFDHRDIFIDPDPDAATSFAERQRMFALPRSSWQDYDTSLISEGGGVYSRSLKSVPLSDRAREVLGLGAAAVTPNEVMRAILKARVDLLWFGGIGTYIRASSESDAEAGDKANDAIRVTGAEVGARVVGEGANLGATQLGRVEYALKGGRINTDAIDNSAGVNSSDLEVNIKIALGTLVRSGEMTLAQRNPFLVSMTDEVAELCLRNNYLQTLALSVEQHRGLAALPGHISLMHALEADGELDREVEYLPDDSDLRERAKSGKGLTRPELAVLLAYAKNTVQADLVASDVPDDPYLARELFRYFPDQLADSYGETIGTHRLRREVIATVLANAMINRGGPAYVTELVAASSADVGRIAASYATVRDVFSLGELNRDIEALDGMIGGRVQIDLFNRVQTLLRNESLWFLRNAEVDGGLAPLIERFAVGVNAVREGLGGLLPEALADLVETRSAQLQIDGVPEALARRVAELPVLGLGTDIVLVAERVRCDVDSAAEAFFGVLGAFQLGGVLEAGGEIVLDDRFDRMALDRALANLLRAQRDLTYDVLTSPGMDVPAQLAAWQADRGDAIGRVAEAVRGLTEGEMTVSRLTVAAGLLSDLARNG
ncbi:NAD-glutamate dehydrogenase [Devosia sp.]|uniref:NAD-glutamate dehydrogenase n=1 Tax=Devosia sp. TaxID=1871048 RepID=UPI003A900C29